MNNLIIDAARDKIFFTIMADNKSYTSEFINNRENFDKLTILIVKFLENHELNIKNIDNIFVNQGPGKFSGVRASLATAKALSFVNKIDLYGFNSNKIIYVNYVEIIDLERKSFPILSTDIDFQKKVVNVSGSSIEEIVKNFQNKQVAYIGITEKNSFSNTLLEEIYAEKNSDFKKIYDSNDIHKKFKIKIFQIDTNE